MRRMRTNGRILTNSNSCMVRLYPCGRGPVVADALWRRRPATWLLSCRSFVPNPCPAPRGENQMNLQCRRSARILPVALALLLPVLPVGARPPAIAEEGPPAKPGTIDLEGAFSAIERGDDAARESGWVVLQSVLPGELDLLPGLLPLLESESSQRVTCAAYVIGNIGPEAGSEWQNLLPLLGHKSSQVRMTVVETLPIIRPPPDEVERRMRQLLKDPVERVRVSTAASLADLGLADEEVVLIAAGFLKSENRILRYGAAVALRFAGPSAAFAYEDLLAAIKTEKDEEIAWALVDAARSVDPGFNHVTDAARVRSVLRGSARVIGGEGKKKLEPSAQARLDVIVNRHRKAFGSEDSDRRLAAVEGMLRVLKPEDALDFLVQALRDRDDRVKLTTLRGLCQGHVRSPISKDFVSALKALAVHSDPEIRIATAEFLANLSSDMDECKALIAERLKSTKGAERCAWACAAERTVSFSKVVDLLRQGAGDKRKPPVNSLQVELDRVVPSIVELFEGADPGARTAAVGFLRRVIEEDKKVMRAAIDQLKSPDGLLKRAAMDLLSGWDDPGFLKLPPESIPLLEKLKEDVDPYVARNAEALLELGAKRRR